MKSIRLTALSCALLLALSAAGCVTKAGDASSAPSAVSSGGGDASSSLPEESTTQSTAPAGDLNIFTGLYDLEKGADNRPAAFMINNLPKARPQFGLDQADLFFEAETEGGITRIMAVFASVSKVPSQLGSIRSARTPFVKLARSLDAVYIHHGGSIEGQARIKDFKLNDVDGLIYEGSTLWRDPEYRKTKGAEHSVMISGEKLADRISKLKYRTTSDRTAPYAYSDNQAGSPATDVQVYISRFQQVNFQYDAEKKLYFKYNGADRSDPHKSAEGVQISASNVILMYDRFYQETEQTPVTYTFDLEKGRGVLCSGGVTRNLSWERGPDGLRFKEADSSALKVAPGKTYVCLINQNNEGKSTIS